MKNPAKNILNSQFSILNSNKGFSLVEMLVVVSIMVTILSIGVASYSSFNRTSIIEGASKQLRANLRQAQAYGQNGEKIGTTCVGAFNGYYVTLANTATSYQMGQWCQTSGATPRTPPSPVTLPTGVTITNLTSSPLTVLFKSIKGVTFYNCNPAPCFTSSVAGPFTVRLTLGSLTRDVLITSKGKIQ